MVPEKILNSGVNKKSSKELSFLETVTGSSTFSDSLKCSRGLSPMGRLTGLQTGDAVTLLSWAGSFQFVSALNIQNSSTILCLNLQSINFLSNKYANTEFPINGDMREYLEKLRESWKHLANGTLISRNDKKQSNEKKEIKTNKCSRKTVVCGQHRMSSVWWQGGFDLSPGLSPQNEGGFGTKVFFHLCFPLIYPLPSNWLFLLV